MTCDWCNDRNRPAYEISFGRDILHICGICYMGIQSAIFGEDIGEEAVMLE
jgi:hypothetical protein